MTLYEVDQMITDAIEFCVDPETGEMLEGEALKNKIEELNMEKEKKVEGVLLWVKNMDAEAAAIRYEEKNLADRRRAIEKRMDSVKNFIQNYLEGEKFKTSKVAVSYRKVSNKVVVDNLDLLDLDWFKQPRNETNLRKTDLKDALMRGSNVPGAHLEDYVSMSIK